ncbi:hypothetical protein [Nocardia wallacei]|uniref:hypothetical protein n=1 Tax=Nocardia wallacei TaxID=480035 RepID=UPI002456693A|nr:hypothetical protein [Nocardia wallacei]
MSVTLDLDPFTGTGWNQRVNPSQRQQPKDLRTGNLNCIPAHLDPDVGPDVSTGHNDELGVLPNRSPLPRVRW